MELKLNTLTYGTKLAFFIATKCLSVIAADLRKTDVTSSAAHFIKNSFYMNDLLAGAEADEKPFNFVRQFMLLS